MSRSLAVRHGSWIVPLGLLLACWGRLLLQPSSVLVDSARPTIDRARVVDAQPGNDLTRQFWPLQRYISRSLVAIGRLPQWDNRGFGGRPLIGNPQAGLFYPPVWIAWLIPAPASLGWLTLGHLLWMGLGVRWLAKMIGLPAPGVMVATGCAILNPYVIAQTFEGHYPHVWAASWYPWAFGAQLALLRGQWSAGLGLVVCLAAVVLVGHPQEGFYLILSLGVWASSDLLQRIRRVRTHPQKLATILGLWLGVLALTLGLVAVDLIPTSQIQAWTLRTSRLPVHLASRYHPMLINGWQLLNPLALGGPADYFGPDNYWETVLSIGLIPAILASAGVLMTRDRSRVRGWMILVGGAVWFAAGRQLGLFALLYEWLPGIDRFRVPARSLFLVNLGCALLAGLGVEAFMAAARSRQWIRLGRVWLVGLVLIGLAIGWGHARVVRKGLTPASFGASSLVELSRSRVRSATDSDRSALALDRIARQIPFWVAMGGVSGALVCGVLRPSRSREIAAGLGLLGLIELAGSGYSVLVWSSPETWVAVGPIEKAMMQALPNLGRANEPPPRVRADEAVLTDLKAVVFGLAKTDINDTFQIQHAADLYTKLYELSRPRPPRLTRPMDGPVAEWMQQQQQAVCDRMGVVLAAGDDHSPRLESFLNANRWQFMARPGGAGSGSQPSFVARNPKPFPRAYLTSADHAINLGLIQFEPTHQPVEWIKAEADYLILNPIADRPCLLVVAETWMPGWSATIDDRPTEVRRVNGAQLAVAIAPGRHEVCLRYRAPGFRLGLSITLGSIVVWVGLYYALQANRWRIRTRTIT